MDILTVSETAKLLGMHPDSIRRLSREGRIKTYRDFRGWRFFMTEDVERVKRERGELRPDSSNSQSEGKG